MSNYHRYVPLVTNTSQLSHHWVCNTMGVTSGAGTACPSRAPEFAPSFMCALSFSFCPLCCLSFDLRIPTATSLASSNSSCKSLTNFYLNMLYRVHLARAKFELTLVVMGTDCIGSHKSDGTLSYNVFQNQC